MASSVRPTDGFIRLLQQEGQSRTAPKQQQAEAPRTPMRQASDPVNISGQVCVSSAGKAPEPQSTDSRLLQMYNRKGSQG